MPPLRLAIASAALLVGLTGRFDLSDRDASSAAPSAVAGEPSRSGLVAAPGRVEPRSEQIELSAEVGGRLKAVLVRAGDVVEAGAVVAELENDAAKARVTVARAQLEQKEAALRRL